MQVPTTYSNDDLPKYCTPVEVLNECYSHDGPATTHSVPTTVTTIGNPNAATLTFGTSPFTSPPVFGIEIFVSKEEVVVYDEVAPAPPAQEACVLTNIDKE
jgi:formate-dependent phosphoribosylglycinamide formyltransferase (GAR transformylase)